MADSRRVTVMGRFTGGPLFEPKESKEGRIRHAAVIALDPGEGDKIKAIIETARQEKWGGKNPPGMEIHGVRVGDDPEYDATYGRDFIRPKSVNKPKTLRKDDGIWIDVTAADDVIYPGCLVAVSVNAYAYDAKKDEGIRPGVSLNLRAVMFRGHAERLSDYVDLDQEFADVEEVGGVLPGEQPDDSFLNS